ncbi:amidohydrolase family protein [Streptosporangium amethystogenes subsp. fukuiense]|uniref:Amidohydrolase family protein n=1 Tax=Streptosporangium amethystogenes subsp. fukuiense TaxID=698418 RepID=A0ABW2TB51_9ACTN
MSQMIAIEGGTVIDGTGAPARAGETVLIHEGRIAAVGVSADEIVARTPDALRIDASGKTVMPGLIDAHTHLSFGEPTGNDELFFHRTEAYSSMLSAHNSGKVLRAGVTSVMDADCLWNIGVELRDAIEAGIVEGPRMRAGGNALMTMLGGTAGRLIRDEGTTGYATVVHNLDGITREVRRQVKHGVDWIKIMVTGLIPSVKGPEVKVWSQREIRAVVEAAHELNTPVVGHCRNSISTKESAEAGVDMIYHSSYMDDAALEAVLENGTTLCPTLTLLGNLVDYGEKVGTAPALLDVFKAELEVTGEMIGKAHRAGVRVITGSETGFAVTPCGEWHARELDMLVRYAGFSPMEAIVAATSKAAWAMKMEGQVGALVEGYVADVIVVDGDPLKDVTVLVREGAIHEVIKDGVRVDLTRPIPERRPRAGEKVAFLAACPLTRAFAFEDTALAASGVEPLTDEQILDLSRA